MGEHGQQSQPAIGAVITAQQLISMATGGTKGFNTEWELVFTMTGSIFGGAYLQIFNLNRMHDYHSMKHIVVLALMPNAPEELSMFMIISVTMSLRKCTDMEAPGPFSSGLWLDPP